MGTSFVGYRGRGFWSWDGYLEHLLFLLSEAIGPSPDEPWLNEVRDHWLEQASGAFTAGIHPQLDEYATSIERRNVILALIGDVISSPNVTQEVKETAELLRRLLLGQISTDESTPLDYMVSGQFPYEWCVQRDLKIEER